MNTGFSNRMKDVFTYVREEVIRLGDESISVEHLFLGILREGGGIAIKIIDELGVNKEALRSSIESSMPKSDVNNEIVLESIEFKKQTERILKKSIMERKNLGCDEIKTIHVLLAIMLDNNNLVTKSLQELRISYDLILEQYESKYLDIEAKLDDTEEDDVFGPSKQEHQKTKTKNATPILDNFGRDLTQYAKEDKSLNENIVGVEWKYDCLNLRLSFERAKFFPFLDADYNDVPYAEHIYLTNPKVKNNLSFEFELIGLSNILTPIDNIIEYGLFN